jgi:predicted nucleic acid-binding protein
MVITSALIEQGIDISIQSQLAFWDGLIIAVAEAGHCSAILSEDMNDGQLIRGIRIVNPFTTSAQ